MAANAEDARMCITRLRDVILNVGNDMLTLKKEKNSNRRIPRKIFSVLESANTALFLTQALQRVTHQMDAALELENLVKTPFTDINHHFGDEMEAGVYIRTDSMFKAGNTADWKRWCAEFYFLLHQLAVLDPGKIVLGFGWMTDFAMQLTSSAGSDMLDSSLAMHPTSCKSFLFAGLLHISNTGGPKSQFKTHPLTQSGDHVVHVVARDTAGIQVGELYVGVLTHVRKDEAGSMESLASQCRVKRSLKNILLHKTTRSVSIWPQSFSVIENDPVYLPFAGQPPALVIQQLLNDPDIMYHHKP